MTPIHLHFALPKEVDQATAIEAVKSCVAQEFPEVQVVGSEVPKHRDIHTVLEWSGFIMHVILAVEMWHLRHKVKELLMQLQEVPTKVVSLTGKTFPELKIRVGSRLVPVKDLTEQDIGELQEDHAP